ncbi:MAG: hypothetical protein ACK42G_08965, partial [Candidatus Kapaibacteriota bacterium]
MFSSKNFSSENNLENNFSKSNFVVLFRWRNSLSNVFVVLIGIFLFVVGLLSCKKQELPTTTEANFICLNDKTKLLRQE